MPSGSCVVTRWPPRTSLRAPSSASRGTEAEREDEMLDRDELVVERLCSPEGAGGRPGSSAPSGRALCSADGGQRPQARFGLGQDGTGSAPARWSERPRQLLLQQRHDEVVARQLRVTRPAREPCAPATASPDLIVNLLKSISAPSRCSALPCRRLRPVQDHLTPVLPVGLVDLGSERRLEVLHPGAEAAKRPRVAGRARRRPG